MSRLPEPPFVAHAAPEPRRWVRSKPVADAHVAQSRHAIEELAALVEPGAAMVLGTGPASEIPLATLADRFELLRLNDHDSAALDAAIRAHGLEGHQPPIELDQSDLTGVTQRFLDAAFRISRETASADVAIERLAELAEQTQPVPYRAREPFDLIVASCVLSQLHVRVAEQTLLSFAERFGEAAVSQLRASTRWVRALAHLARHMENEFITSIYHLLSPQGQAYVADTVQFCYVHGTPEGNWASDGSYRMTRTLQLADYLDDRFRIGRLGNWSWVHNAPKAPGDVGRLYHVQALAVARR